MSDILKGRVAVVTGSGQGIGRALALGLAAHGAKVVTNNRKPGSTGNAMVSDAQFEKLSADKKDWYKKTQQEFNGDAETTAQAIRDAGGEAVSFFGDISRFDAAEQLIKTAVDNFGRVDILCNVAGAFGFGEIDEISEELWDRVNSVKPKGYFNTMHFAVPYMKKQRYGRIINCTSRAFMGDVIKHAEYCAANAGVVGLTRGAAIELREYGITCNAFGPFAKTRAAYELEAIDAVKDKPLMVSGKTPPAFDGTPTPEMIVPFLVYLASEQSAQVSGSVFSLAGNSIQLHQEPVVCRTMQKEGRENPWTVEEIIQSAPMALFSDYRSIADL